jgi:hypothetical protein
VTEGRERLGLKGGVSARSPAPSHQQLRWMVQPRLLLHPLPQLPMLMTLWPLVVAVPANAWFGRPLFSTLPSTRAQLEWLPQKRAKTFSEASGANSRDTVLAKKRQIPQLLSPSASSPARRQPRPCLPCIQVHPSLLCQHLANARYHLAVTRLC